MAAAYVKVVAQLEDNDNSAAPLAVPITSAPSTGSRIVVIAQNEDGLPNACSDNVMGAYTKLRDLPGSPVAPISVWISPVLTGVPTSITVTKAAAVDRPTSVSAFEFTGVSATLSTAGVDASGGHVTTQTIGPTGTPSQADTLVLAIWTTNDVVTYANYTAGYTEIADFGSLGGASATVHHAVAYRVLATATAQTVSSDRTGGAGTNWAGSVLILNAASSGNTFTKTGLGIIGP